LPAGERPPQGFLEITPADVDLPITKHLRVGDFLNHDQQGVWPTYAAVNPKLLDKLELVIQEIARWHGDKAVANIEIDVHSGFRAPEHNRKIRRAARDSQHQYGVRRRRSHRRQRRRKTHRDRQPYGSFGGGDRRAEAPGSGRRARPLHQWSLEHQLRTYRRTRPARSLARSRLTTTGEEKGMNDILRERLIRKLDTLPEERVYQILDYIDFLESKYAPKVSTAPNPLKRFAEGVEDTLRAGKMSANVIGGTMNVMHKAVGVLTDRR